MIKIKGDVFKNFKKNLEKKVIEKVKNDKISELKRKGLYKPGITKVEVIINKKKDGFFRDITKR
mgnify:FL=1